MLDLDPIHRASGHGLLKAAVGTPLQLLRCESRPTTDGDFAVHVDCKLLREDVRHAAIPLIFTLAMISFGEARPRGLSEADFVDGAEFTPADFVEHLHFEDGELCLDLDYLRGRMVKTHVRVSKQGILHVDTVNRGEVLPRWVNWLKGKPHLRALPTLVDESASDGDQHDEP